MKAYPVAIPVLAGVLTLVVFHAAGGEAAKKGKGQPSGSGIVKITSMPMGAAVDVDGEYGCTTPCTLEIQEGSHTFKVHTAGYVEAYQTIDVRADVVEKLKFNLAKSGKGKIKPLPTTSYQTLAEKGLLTVKTDPPGLAVKVNGVLVDDETPFTVEIEQGKYYVTVEHQGESVEKVVEVEPGQPTVVVFDAQATWKKSPVGQKDQALITAKKELLAGMMATGFARLVIGSSGDDPFSVLIDGEPAGFGPGPGGSYTLVLQAGQTVQLSFTGADQMGLGTALGLAKDHEYRLDVSFLPDYVARIEDLLSMRPDVHGPPLPPSYLDETYTEKKNAARCLVGGVLSSAGLTSWIVAPIMMVGGVRTKEPGLVIGGGVFLPLGLAFNIWGIYDLVTGCKRVEKIDHDAAAQNEKMKADFEAELEKWDLALSIDEKLDELEAKQAAGDGVGEVTVEDMGPVKPAIMSPEAEELSKEIYGTSW